MKGRNFMAHTVFYRGKLKKNRTPDDVFAKIIPLVKPKGVTKRWSYTIDEWKGEKRLVIDFGDSKSEHLVFCFPNDSINGSCKTSFHEHQSADAGNREFEFVLSILYTIMPMFAEFDVIDDFQAWDDFLESKRFKIKLRELTEAESKRIQALYDTGYTSYKDIIFSIIYDDLGYKPGDTVSINPKYEEKGDVIHTLYPVIATWIHDTMSYKGKIRIDQAITTDDWRYSEAAGWASFNCACGIAELLGEPLDPYLRSAPIQQLRQITKFSDERFLPLFDEEQDNYKRCVLAYRYVVSVLDYGGLQFAGRLE